MKLSISVKGKTVDDQTRCVHYHSALDVIALKFKCCSQYYPCFYCHAEEAGHPPQKWEKHEFEEKAVLCGVCKNELTIGQYLESNYTCPFCNAPFNPNCYMHNHLYFEQ